MMILSDGGVHSHIKHLKNLLLLLPEDVNIQLHIASDGRDVASQSLPQYLEELSDEIASRRIQISTLCGRYFTFDRADNWDRMKKAYDVMTQMDRENCPHSQDIINILQSRYAS